MADDGIISIVPNQVFAWEAGLCLKATQRVIISLPGSIVPPDETIGSLIKLSDSRTKIEFQETSQGGMRLIRIELGAGVSLKINRKTEAIVNSISHEALKFEIMPS